LKGVFGFGQIRQAIGKRARSASDLGVLVHVMQGFIRRANTAEFRKILETSTDEDQRRIVLRLLAEEEAKAPSSKKSRTPATNVASLPTLRSSW
jgi:hypothetical protein